MLGCESCYGGYRPRLKNHVLQGLLVPLQAWRPQKTENFGNFLVVETDGATGNFFTLHPTPDPHHSCEKRTEEPLAPTTTAKGILLVVRERSGMKRARHTSTKNTLDCQQLNFTSTTSNLKTTPYRPADPRLEHVT